MQECLKICQANIFSDDNRTPSSNHPSGQYVVAPEPANGVC